MSTGDGELTLVKRKRLFLEFISRFGSFPILHPLNASRIAVLLLAGALSLDHHLRR